jgi:hypothetical protein
MKIFIATPSQADKKYIASDKPAQRFVSGQVGMWVVWDVMVGCSGYFARLVPEHNGGPLGFCPCEINGEVFGYSRQEEVGS